MVLETFGFEDEMWLKVFFAYSEKTKTPKSFILLACVAGAWK